MVVCASEHGSQAEIIFVIEATAVNGAYINDIKTNYIMPSLEYFSQGNLDESNFPSDNTSSVYGIVTYQASDCLPHPTTDTFGPFTSPAKVYNAIERLELIGGKGESHANIAEGLATALQCFEELQAKREQTQPTPNAQKHCVLVCNSPPYLMPVMESVTYAGKNCEQLASVLQEKSINLTVISPRKIPALYKLFEKAGGDLSTSQTKNYAKDPRHLVLLKGFSLKERPISPPPVSNVPTSQQLPNPNPIASLPSPGGESPIQNQNNPNHMGGNAGNVGPGQSPIYRPNQEYIGINQMQQKPQGVNQVGGRIMQPPLQQQTSPQQLAPMAAPPQYTMNATGQGRWLPQQQQGAARPQGNYMQNQGGGAPQGGSALLAQLAQPPNSMAGGVPNQFVQLNAPSPKMMPPQQNPIPQGQQAMVNQSPNQPIPSQAPSPSQANQPTARERHTIWSGLLEWIEKPKNTTDQQKITKQVPCQVSANTKEGEPELKADGWPSKLIMQLMPKQLIGNIGGAYLKNSKSVLFHPSNCEALESLTRVMSSGFAGCVHFTSMQNSPCDVKVLILLYTSDKRAYLGFIPNDQTAFVDRLRKVIQQQKSSQQLKNTMGVVPTPGGGPMMPTPGPGCQMGVAVSAPSPQQQGGMMIAQTANPLSMGGGQITQNVVAGGGQPASQMGGVMPPGMRPNIRMQQQQQPQQQQQGGGGEFEDMPGMMGGGGGGGGGPVQRAPFENQLQVERQQNLEKINQLRQTLEAAQQQEQQYKSQLERISHMKTSQLQEALQNAQQVEMQYKMMDQQRQIGNPGNQQQNPGQQRIMRPGMPNNPGLRHLLQQQPQYRQMMNMQQQMGAAGGAPRPMGQQMPNQANSQANTFDEPPYDFM